MSALSGGGRGAATAQPPAADGARGGSGSGRTLTGGGGFGASGGGGGQGGQRGGSGPGRVPVMAVRRRRQRPADVYPIHPTTTRPLHLAAESGAAAAAGRPERQSRPPPGGVLEGGGRVGWARWGGGPGGGWKRRGDGWGMKRMSLARGGRPGKGGGSARSAQALAPARRGRRICQCGVRAGQGKGGGMREGGEE